MTAHIPESDDLPDPRVNVEITDSFAEVNLPAEQIEYLVHAIAAHYGLEKAVISIAIVDNAEIQHINKRYLGRNRITDVISWDLSEDHDPQRIFEIVVNGQKAVSEAQSRGHSPRAELALYITHGILHNLGFDDLTPEQAVKMHTAENHILEQTGYGQVYDI
mgnify:CR=1 FL=1